MGKILHLGSQGVHYQHAAQIAQKRETIHLKTRGNQFSLTVTPIQKLMEYLLDNVWTRNFGVNVLYVLPARAHHLCSKKEFPLSSQIAHRNSNIFRGCRWDYCLFLALNVILQLNCIWKNRTHRTRSIMHIINTKRKRK